MFLKNREIWLFLPNEIYHGDKELQKDLKLLSAGGGSVIPRLLWMWDRIRN